MTRMQPAAEMETMPAAVRPHKIAATLRIILPRQAAQSHVLSLSLSLSLPLPVCPCSTCGCCCLGPGTPTTTTLREHYNQELAGKR